MNYDLAKQLKDAGFTMKVATREEEESLLQKTREMLPESFPSLGYIVVQNVLYHLPTLSELIEACGESFEVLQKNYLESDDKLKKNFVVKGWEAVGVMNQKLVFGKGSTPEEAVANLWLALNKK